MIPEEPGLALLRRAWRGTRPGRVDASARHLTVGTKGALRSAVDLEANGTRIACDELHLALGLEAQGLATGHGALE
jgi:hypothetical protein